MWKPDIRHLKQLLKDDIGIFCAIVVPISKKDKAKLEDLKAQISKEKLDKLKEFKFENAESSDKNMYVGTGIVDDITKSENNVKVTLMFFNLTIAINISIITLINY